jgi:signal transduction histidine kinase
MSRPVSSRASLAGHRLLPVTVALALAGGCGLAWHLAGGSTVVGDPSGPWAWLPMLSFGAVCGLAGWLWGKQQASTRLRDARMGQQQLLQLVDAWVWESDDRHQLTMWRPPHNAPASAWGHETPAGMGVWERFELASPDAGKGAGALRARLDSQGLLADLRVLRVDASPATVWRMQAVPQFDGDGRFVGYIGSAAPLADDEQRGFDQAVLDQLWPEMGLAAVALRLSPSGEWTVDALSDDAQQLLKLDGAPARGLPWPLVRRALPEALAQAEAGLAPGQSRDEGDWALSLSAIQVRPNEPAGRLLLLRAVQRAPVEDSVSASDHESFTYSISHDLRAPIRVVDGFARILKEDYGRFLDRIGNDHLDRVLAAAARMNSMIDALLALSRLQSQPLQRKPVDLSQLASFIIEDLQRESPDRAADVQIEAGIVVHGDPTLLRIAMDNLLGNAWKYSGQCTLTHIEFRREQRDGRTVMVVADQGAGFDMRFADRLFGVFQRLHSPKDFQGTGVGLASVRRILRRHGGDIWAESEVGKGARFYFTLG